MSVGEVGFGALDASAVVVNGPVMDEAAHAAALLAEAEQQLEAAKRAEDGATEKAAKFTQLAQNAQADLDHAQDECDRLRDLVQTRRATLEGLI